MKKETWKTVIQVIVSILTAALTAMGTTSCRATAHSQSEQELANLSTSAISQRGCGFLFLFKSATLPQCHFATLSILLS